MSGADDVGLVQLLKNREDGIAGKNTSATKERKRGKYKTDEVESMDKVQMLGEAFQKIQAATGIHVPSPPTFCPHPFRLASCQHSVGQAHRALFTENQLAPFKVYGESSEHSVHDVGCC